MKKALITGCAGQDGTYLAQYLLSLGYEVFGLVHRTPCTVAGITPLYGDVRDKLSLEVAFHRSQPDEVYNLAGQVFVPASWREPEETLNINTGGLARVCEVALRTRPQARIYQASSSEMFGQRPGTCNEESPMTPTSPYGVSKLASHKLVSAYRQKWLYVVSGILFNHESPLRGPEMVTRKITRHVAQWKLGLTDDALVLGDIQSRRDWGFAGDYVKAMHSMMQQPKPDDYVIGTGLSHSVEDFLRAAIQAAGLDVEEYLAKVQSSREFARPGEIHQMRADVRKAHTTFGWTPETEFVELVRLMVDADIQRLIRGKEQYVGTYPVGVAVTSGSPY